MVQGTRLRRTPERQSQAPATVSHVRGYARGSIGEGGDRGVCRFHLACSRAVQTVGTLWAYLLAGREQSGARSGGNTRHNSGSFGRQGGQGSGAGRRVCRTSAENPGYKVIFAGAKGQHNSCLRRDECAARRGFMTQNVTVSASRNLLHTCSKDEWPKKV